MAVSLITTLADKESRITGLRAGADDFITKPFDSTELLVRLRGIIRLNRFRRNAEQRHEIEVMHKELLISMRKPLKAGRMRLIYVIEKPKTHLAGY